jgi:tRNA G18 (ribose-2'-O)-methylase SpoU
MPEQMKGYFGIGVERISKPMNIGNLFRSAHAFGASFLFTVGADVSRLKAPSDTSAAPDSLPTYHFASADELVLPGECALVAVELVDDAVQLPSFRHPKRAAYLFGPERGAVSPALLARADRRVKIPTRFCINLAAAGVVVMYDRMISLGRFAERAVSPMGRPVPLPEPAHGSKADHLGGRVRAASKSLSGQ